MLVAAARNSQPATNKAKRSLEAAFANATAETAGEGSLGAAPAQQPTRGRRRGARAMTKNGSSFGRVQNSGGPRHFGGVGDDHYRNRLEIRHSGIGKSKVTLAISTIVQVYFNDPEHWREVKARCGSSKPTVDHIDSRNEKKRNDHHSNLRWATPEEQRTNQIRSEAGKNSQKLKLSGAQIQVRHCKWDGLKQEFQRDD